MRILLYLRAILIFALLLLGACGIKQESNVVYGNTHKILFIANGDDPAILDPQLATGLSERNIFQALFEGLTNLSPDSMEIMPGVATTWELLEDHITYIFYLNESAHWSNGDPITAEDFIYSWRRLLDPNTAASYAYMLYSIKNAEAFNKGELASFSEVGVLAVDRHILKVTLARPTPYFLQLLSHHAFYPIHPTTIEKYQTENPLLSNWTLPANIVSNGPFTLSEWNIDNNIKVTKNPHYWNATNVKLNGIVFQHIADKSVEERAFRTGQVHLTNTPRMSIEKIAAYKKNKPNTLLSSPLYATIYYVPNTDRAPFSNPLVRRALSLAIDRETIVSRVTKSGEKAAFNFVPPNPKGFSTENHYQYNPQGARELLSAAGYPNGENFPEFELLLVNEQSNRHIAIAIQQMWKQNLNIHMKLRTQEWKAWLQTRAAKDFTMSTGSWYADYIDASNFFDVLRSESGNNHSGWQNKMYDSLLDQAVITQDNLLRKRYLEQASALLAEEMPVIPLFYPMNNNLVHSSVKNWRQNLAGTIRYQDIDLN